MRLFSALLVGLCLVSVPVLADTADPPATSIVADDVTITATSAAPAVAPAPGVIVDDGALVAGTIRELVDIASNAKVAGFGLAIVLAIAALLKLITKHGAVARLLERTGKTWIRPLLSAATGAVTALGATLSVGVRDPLSIGAAIVTGILTGLGAAGYVDAARVALFPDARKKRTVDEADLVTIAESIESQAAAGLVAVGLSVEAAKERVLMAKQSLSPSDRVKALANMMKAKP